MRKTIYRDIELNTNTLPLAAIIGRPNVGKSTLFNALIGKRYAITSPTPGVTRDALILPWCYGGTDVLLADTGGMHDGDEMTTLVVARAHEIIARAQVLLLIVDVSGLVSEDIEIADLLRPHAHKVIVVVNKVDNEKRALQQNDFYGLGFPKLIAVSAAHRRNFGALGRAVGAMIADAPTAAPAAEADADPDTDPPDPLGPPVMRRPECTVAIIGKPNCGKSTLINQLSGSDVSLVTDIAGTTRDTVMTGHTITVGDSTLDLRMLDTAGQRRRSREMEDVEFYSVRRAQEAVDSSNIVLLVVDITEGLTTQDKKIADRAAERGCGIIFVLNKIDLVQKAGIAVSDAEDVLRARFPHLAFVPLVSISAHTGEGVPELLETVGTLWERLNRRVPTAALNRFMLPLTDGLRIRRLKLRYVTQSGTNPLEFIFFVNSVQYIPRNLKSFYSNTLRQEFDYTGTPLLLHFREGSSRRA